MSSAKQFQKSCKWFIGFQGRLFAITFDDRQCEASNIGSPTILNRVAGWYDPLVGSLSCDISISASSANTSILHVSIYAHNGSLNLLLFIEPQRMSEYLYECDTLNVYLTISFVPSIHTNIALVTIRVSAWIHTPSGRTRACILDVCTECPQDTSQVSVTWCANIGARGRKRGRRGEMTFLCEYPKITRGGGGESGWCKSGAFIEKFYWWRAVISCCFCPNGRLYE